jgi:ABC-type dipeptide/oligopeptide/nickel transport system permease subunit
MRKIWRSTAGKFGLILLFVLLFLALFGPMLTPFEYNDQNLDRQFLAPMQSFENGPIHLLGTDNLGRDVLTRLVVGARISFTVGLVAVGLAFLVGVPLGTLAGYFGGRVDSVIMRSMDVLLAFPSILLAIAIVAVFGVSLTNAMLAVGVVTIPVFCRLSRASVLTVKEREYVAAARAQGASHTRLMGLYILPNCIEPLLVQAALSMGTSVLDAAGLSFLGLGARPPTPEWGTMLGDAFLYFQRAPWCVAAPGAMIFLMVLAFNLFGDGLGEALEG